MTGSGYEVITFDCYGTLIDWREGIARAFLDAASGAGCAAGSETFLDLYASTEAAIEGEKYRPYREVLSLAASRVMELVCHDVRTDGGFLPASLPGWQPFADTNEALARLRGAGHRLGILSNVDRDLLAGTRAHLSVPFDIVVTAEDVRSYKPAPAHFAEARRQIGNRRWLHVAQSRYHDVVPCRRLGIPVVWINRTAERPVTPEGADREFETLTGLADWLAPLS